jgi:hypothetical protein
MMMNNSFCLATDPDDHQTTIGFRTQSELQQILNNTLKATTNIKMKIEDLSSEYAYELKKINENAFNKIKKLRLEIDAKDGEIAALRARLLTDSRTKDAEIAKFKDILKNCGHHMLAAVTGLLEGVPIPSNPDSPWKTVFDEFRTINPSATHILYRLDRKKRLVMYPNYPPSPSFSPTSPSFSPSERGPLLPLDLNERLNTDNHLLDSSDDGSVATVSTYLPPTTPSKKQKV